MPTIPEVPFSIVASALPDSITKNSVALIIVAVVAVLIYYVSPQRLTYILLDAMAKVKGSYFHALETGHLSTTEIERLPTLQRQVSAIHVETLQSSRSHWRALSGFFKGRSLTILCCIWDVRDFETHIKALVFLACSVESSKRIIVIRAAEVFLKAARARQLRQLLDSILNAPPFAN
ncbi:hypothetical protein B0H19DRAFT_1061290 [Mycena capillaripes]|nr:hypothetical protein B0H19DRAFT_1061290 [Mycena capillaripes]